MSARSGEELNELEARQEPRLVKALEMVAPGTALREGIDSGELRLAFVLTDYQGLGHGAWIEDMKTGMEAWVRNHSAWKRFALVTDVEWVAKAMRAFAWMAPGEVRVFGIGELDAAREWVAG